MLPKQRVVWTDGMIMESVHFQQQERYLENYIHAKVHGVDALFWGFTKLEINQEMLSQGLLAIKRAKGIFPDGTPFDLGGQDPLPEPFLIEDACQDEVIMLSIVYDMPGNIFVNLSEDNIISRYKAIDVEFLDRTYGSPNSYLPEKSIIQLGQIQTRLNYSSSTNSTEALLPVCYIREKVNHGKVIFDDNFLPPLLHIGANGWLENMTKELLGVITQRAHMLFKPQTTISGGGINEFYELMLLQQLGEYHFKLSHLLSLPQLHPERLFYVLSEMLGKLSFVPNADLIQANKIIYQHKSPSESFSVLFSNLYRVLSLVIESPAIPLRFVEQTEGVFVYPNDPHQRLDKIIFIVNADVPKTELQQNFPLQIKLASSDKISQLIQLQLPGVDLIPLVTPPRYIPYYPNSIYFEADVSSELYRDMISSSTMAMSVVGNFPGLHFDIWGIKAIKNELMRK